MINFTRFHFYPFRNFEFVDGGILAFSMYKRGVATKTVQHYSAK